METSKNYFVKTDLHLHLDGAVKPETLLELGLERGVDLPATTLEDFTQFVVVSKDCRSVNEYLEKFELPTTILQDKEALARVAYELVERLDSQFLGYAEIRFAPQIHTRKGLTQQNAVEAVISGMNSAKRKNGIKTGLILCAMSLGDPQGNRDQNLTTVDVAKSFLGRGVNAVDLAGMEKLYPLSDFSYVFSRARELEIPFTCHAGDSDGPQSVRTAVMEFGSRRIGHGHRVFDDKELCEIVKEKGVTFEISLTSNIQCHSQPSYEMHPAKKMLDMGINVTLCTDNPIIAGVTIDSEYDVALNRAGFTHGDLVKMSKIAINAAFISQEDKQKLLGY